jgi:hypothetical protein
MLHSSRIFLGFVTTMVTGCFGYVHAEDAAPITFASACAAAISLTVVIVQAFRS